VSTVDRPVAHKCSRIGVNDVEHRARGVLLFDFVVQGDELDVAAEA